MIVISKLAYIELRCPTLCIWNRVHFRDMYGIYARYFSEQGRAIRITLTQMC